MDHQVKYRSCSCAAFSLSAHWLECARVYISLNVNVGDSYHWLLMLDLTFAD